MAAARTQPGITRRILVAFVLLTLLPAGAIAWLGVRTVGRVIEQRLVRERVTNAARDMGQASLPLSRLMMARLSEMFGERHQVAAELKSDAIGEELVSSLSKPDEEEFAAQLKGRATAPATVRIRDHTYVLGTAEIHYKDSGRAHTLYLLVDEHLVNDAKTAAARPILLGAIPALLAVLAAAFYISRTITSPIRRLSAQIEAQLPDESGSGFKVQGSAVSSLDPDPQTSNPSLSATHHDSGLPGLHDVDLVAPRELADLATTFNRMLARLRLTQQRLVDASRLAAVGKIAASVAHEVRNPLAGIRMNLQLLQQHLARGGQSDESLNIAIAELDRLDSIVQEMLILGKKADPNPEPVNLVELANEVVQLMDRRLRHANVQAVLEGGAAMATADPAQLKQVILNLVLNALDAMPQGGTLTLRTSVSRGVARLEIDDTGTGLNLDPDQDPFAWFSTSKSAGSGIGLAVCKQIVDAHEGTIGLQRLPGGTRAWIELPG